MTLNNRHSLFFSLHYNIVTFALSPLIDLRYNEVVQKVKWGYVTWVCKGTEFRRGSRGRPRWHPLYFRKKKQITAVERLHRPIQTTKTSKARTRGEGFVLRQSVCVTHQRLIGRLSFWFGVTYPWPQLQLFRWSTQLLAGYLLGKSLALLEQIQNYTEKFLTIGRISPSFGHRKRNVFQLRSQTP